MRCLNDTAGAQCERCMDGFYGDAITAKNCLGMWCFFFVTLFKLFIVLLNYHTFVSL